MHSALYLPELLDRILFFLEDSKRDLRRLSLASKYFWRPCTAILYAELAQSRGKMRPLLDMYLRSKKRPEATDYHLWQERFLVYSPFVRSVKGTVPPKAKRRDGGALPWPAYQGLYEKLCDWEDDVEWVSAPLFPNVRKLNVGLETVESVQKLMDMYLCPSLEKLELVLGEEVTMQALSVLLWKLPSICPNLEVFALETLSAAHKTIQFPLAVLFPRLVHLHELRLRISIGQTLLDALEEFDLRTLTLYLYDLTVPPPVTVYLYDLAVPQLGITEPLSLPHLRSLELHGEIATCTSFLHSALFTNSTLTALSLHLTGFGTPATTAQLCKSITHARRTLRTLALRSHAARTQGGGIRTAWPSSFAPLYTCAALEDVTLVGGWQGRDRILWRGADLLAVAQAWAGVRSLSLVSQLWHGHRFTPLATMDDLVPLARHCRALRKIAIALDLRAAPAVPAPGEVAPAPALEVIFLAAYSTPPATEEVEMEVGRFVRRLWPRARLCVDPDSTNSPGELERFVDGFVDGFADGTDGTDSTE